MTPAKAIEDAQLCRATAHQRFRGVQAARSESSRSARGFTLVELLVVVSLLSIAGLVVLPASEPTEPYELELAAGEVADAIRHARDEALRMASPHGVHVEASLPRLRVFRADLSTTPPTPLYDVRHPLTKYLYVLDLAAQPTTEGVAVAITATWSDTCSQPELLGFDAAGTPRCGDPWPVVLEASTLTLTYAGHSRSVVIDGVTGRVSVQ